MTEKRYSFNVNKMAIEKDGKHFAFTTIEHTKIVKELNALHEENKALKQTIKKMGELGGFNKHMIKTICGDLE